MAVLLQLSTVVRRYLSSRLTCLDTMVRLDASSSLAAARSNTVRLGSLLRRANASNQKSADNAIQADLRSSQNIAQARHSVNSPIIVARNGCKGLQGTAGQYPNAAFSRPRAHSVAVVREGEKHECKRVKFAARAASGVSVIAAQRQLEHSLGPIA